MQKGTVLQLPRQSSIGAGGGMLWQCQTCELSFVKKQFIDDHLKSYHHQRESFHIHIPPHWQSKYISPPQDDGGEVLVPMETAETMADGNEPDNSNSDYEEEYVEAEIEEGCYEQKVIDTINRRNAILRALLNDEEDMTDRPLSVFRPSDEDKEWVKKIWRNFINEKTKKNRKLGEEIHPDVKLALQSGADIPKLYQRQVARTAENYAYGLTFVAEMYQQKARTRKNDPNYQIRYSDFIDFGNNERHIYLFDPLDYLKNGWESGTLGQKKHFIAAHSNLQMFVWNECLSGAGQEKFVQAHRGEKYADIMGTKDQETYLKLLDRLDRMKKQNSAEEWINQKINNRREKDQRDRDQIWANHYGIGKSEDVQTDIKMFLNSDQTIQAQNLLIEQGTPRRDGKELPPLSTKEWALGTRIRVLTIQVQNSGRTEIVNMTVGEWWERTQIEDALVYTVIIRRDWTKLTGFRSEPAFLSLNAFDEALCIFYDRCRKIQHPKLYPPHCSEPELLAQPFFVNCHGNAYIRPNHGVDKYHMQPWSNLRGRHETQSTFRKALANFSLNTDEVNRLNIAFANQHSKDTMQYWYATVNDKSKAAIKALQNYRENCLGIITIAPTAAGKKIGNRPTKEAAAAALIRWRANLEQNVEREKKEDANKERANIDKRGSNESRAALIELCMTEIQTGQPVGNYYLADYLLRRGKDAIKKKRTGESEIHKAILDVIDSARFFECPSSVSLRNIMVKVARNRNVEIEDGRWEDSIDRLEHDCLFSWRSQLTQLASVPLGTRTSRIMWAMFQIQEASGSKCYNLGNHIIQTNIDSVLDRKLELELDLTNADRKIRLGAAHQKSPGEVVRLHLSAQETSMSPIEVRKCAQAILKQEDDNEKQQREEQESKKPRQSAAKRLLFDDP